MKILLAGASGLVGGLLARNLPAASLTCLARRPLTGLDDRITQLVAEPAQWPDFVARAKPDVAISTLGTTIRVAGSKTAFEAIDLTLIRDFASAARSAGARQFLMVSSVGADARSRNFYLATKGKAEEAARAIGFEQLDIFRPGLLRGDRAQYRPGESIAIAMSPLTDALTPPFWDKYRSIEATQVAAAIARAVGEAGQGVVVHHNREMAGG